MIKHLLGVLLLSMLTVGSHLFAQNARTYKHPAHTFPQTMAWWDSIYLFPDFRPGFITYFTGFAPERELRLNYNLYYAQIDMINPQGDTVQIAPSKTFKSITIGSDEFLYEPKEGYLRVMIKGDVTLAERTYFHLSEMKYVSGSISNNAPHDSDVRGRPSTYDRKYVKASTYFFVSNEGAVYPVSRSILKKFFPEYRNAIQDYTRKHETDFSKESDIRLVTQYCNGLRRLPTAGSTGMIVRANERVSETLRDSIYRFNGFQEGVLVYQDGRHRDYKHLNYNFMTQEIEAIEEGDTLRINSSRFVKTANIDGTNYFRKSEGYIEVIMNGRVIVGAVRSLSMSHSQAIAATSRYGTNESYDPSLAHLDRVNFDRSFTRKNELYLIDERGTVFTPSIGTLRRLFPAAKAQLDNYMRTHQGNFQNEEDLKEVVSFLDSVVN